MKRKVAEHSGKDKILAPTVKNMFDEIKEELESLKKIVGAKEENVADKVSKEVIITKKAVGNRKKKKINATKHSKEDEIVAPTVEEKFDEIKSVDVKNENIVEMESKVMKVNVEELNDLKVDKKMFDEIKDEPENSRKIVDPKDENVVEKVSKVTKVENFEENDLKVEENDLKGDKIVFDEIKEEHPKKDEILAPTVKEMFDEIKEELENLKTFNKKLVAVKNENIAEKESKVKKVKVDEENDLKVDKIVFDELKEELENLKTFNKKLVDEVNDLKRDKNDDGVNDVKKMVDKKDANEDEDKDRKNEIVSYEVEGGMVNKVTKLKNEGECENDEKMDGNLAPIKEIF